MSDPNDNRDDTVPAYGEPFGFREFELERRKIVDASLSYMTLGAMGPGVIRDDSTPPASPNSGPAAPIDFDAYE